VSKRLPKPSREDRPPIPDFTPVPRRYRHDGWTPERQKAFIEALADTGCVDRAARMVNIAQTNAYTLRRAPGAEGFRRAWDAALDFGLKRLKDIAFERAIEGELVPVFQAGKLIGYRRKRNDALLMFCLRHYGQDGQGRRTTINYFSTRASSTSSGQASAGAAAGAGDSPLSGRSAACLSPEGERLNAGAAAEASTTTVRTVISGAPLDCARDERSDGAAAVLNGFEGVRLDAQAEAEIGAALQACAARARAAAAAYDRGGEAAADAAEDDPDARFFRSEHPYRGELVPLPSEEVVPFDRDQAHWTQAGAEVPAEWARLMDAAEAAAKGPAACTEIPQGSDPACKAVVQKQRG
jgi:hypothetical protein